ncbi:3D (Asp-Asp-Asp) domain-containing protein [Paenibacillus algorifonticola]|uniref:3D (Asp-Asp-Asp) domain-containing protein n=1 Tax=Paenibacillus algorifonticola TaxID=684063 RepID=A0A1I2HN83_9BACL|nr:3D domain-containing protein [Paenibacillus algorifonticola]SFF30196.1 3D (Asp-Asp-Asp) domain-containing protein [Paenibacillus algorifonticola]
MKKLSITAAALVLSCALAAAPANAAVQTHKAAQGDTFWKLSQQYKVDLDKLLAANPKINPLNIMVGMKLKVPVAASATNADSAAKVGDQAQPKAAATVKAESLSAKSIIASNGNSYTFSKQLNVKATAYTAAASENGKWGAVDYFGNPLKVGTVAVDSSVIPLGTKLYVTGYDYDGLPEGGMIAVANDMGGAIKGNRIDIFVPGSTATAKSFGIQDVKVYMVN